MAIDSRGEYPRFDFDELANLLMDQGQEASPAELHGCLCGLLASGAGQEAETGIAGASQALGLDLHGELAEQVMTLYLASALAMESEEFDFHPLLLDDNADLASRAVALASWCRGFVAGYLQQRASAGADQSTLPGDSSEILRDMAAIAEADPDDLADDDESEHNYAELTEYIRFAALNAYADTVLRDSEADPGPEPEAPRRH